MFLLVCFGMFSVLFLEVWEMEIRTRVFVSGVALYCYPKADYENSSEVACASRFKTHKYSSDPGDSGDLMRRKPLIVILLFGVVSLFLSFMLGVEPLQ